MVSEDLGGGIKNWTSKGKFFTRCHTFYPKMYLFSNKYHLFTPIFCGPRKHTDILEGKWFSKKIYIRASFLNNSPRIPPQRCRCNSYIHWTATRWRSNKISGMFQTFLWETKQHSFSLNHDILNKNWISLADLLFIYRSILGRLWPWK